MSEENVEIIRRIHEGWPANLDSWVAELDPHAVLVVRRPFPAFGVAVGPDEISKYMSGFLEQWERASLEAIDLRAVGDTVVSHVALHSTGRASGIEGDIRFFILFTFRGGRIVRIECVMDEADALEAAGLRE